MRISIVAAALLLVGCGTAPKQADKGEPPKSVAPNPKITQFYASPATVAPGDRSLLCYGVEHTTTLTLDPPVDEVAPSLSRCIEVFPKETTQYTLSATGIGGAATATAKITVDSRIAHNMGSAKGGRPSAGLIRYFVASLPTVSKGQQVTMCYATVGATSLTLNPPVHAVAPADKMCFNVKVDQTTTFTLTAKDAKGAADSEKLTIKAE